jgi:hypothetical protein
MGMAWPAAADAALGLTGAPAGSARPAHPARQRVYQPACGYEGQHDANTLRMDLRLKHVCGSLPLTETDLATQLTISRLEKASPLAIDRPHP